MMPRKNPVPQREVEVCSRLREFREAMNWSQAGFAREIGVGVSFLANIESGRAPLRYGLAKRIMSILPMNPDWLASGRGNRAIAVDWIPKREYDFTDRDLFTTVYDGSISGWVVPKLKQLPYYKQRPKIFGDAQSRMHGLSLLIEHLFDSLTRVPDDKLDAFLEHVDRATDQFLNRCTEEPREIVKKREAEMDALREALFARKLHFEKISKNAA